MASYIAALDRIHRLEEVRVFKGIAGFAMLGLCVAGALTANQYIQFGAIVVGAIGGDTLLGIHIEVPNDQSEFYLWLICLLAGYLAIMFFVQLVFLGRPLSGIDMVGRVFDGLTFAISVLLLIGVVYHSVLVLIGDTTLFLVLAGTVGVLYGIVRIFL